MSPLRIASEPRHGVERIHLLLCLPWLGVFGYLIHTTWFLCDDAFVSFRYARNLLEGHGLVFNPGEYVEGYSNFLWVLELVALWGAFGLRPEHTAPWLSVACTGGTLAALLWWVARLSGLPQRGLVGWMALGLLCCSTTFAVWTSGGLETRQFTLFVVLAVVGLTLYPENRRALLGVSLSLAVASLTRPEGPLFAACCFGWYAVQRRVDTGHWRPEGRAAMALVVPFAVVVGAHLLFRYDYYGEWLPNTYYAKYVRPWYEMGWRYLAAAAVETGLYLLLPLTFLTVVRDWRARRSLVFLLPLFCIGLHMVYVARIGGDHFEYRPLDFYWPLLAVPAAGGIAHLGGWLATAVQRRVSIWPRLAARPGNCALLIFLPVAFYSSAVQAVLLFQGDKETRRIREIDLDKKNEGGLLAAPGMPRLVTIAKDLGRRLGRHAIGTRFVKHRGLFDQGIRHWQPYEKMARGIIPADALMLTKSAGISPYFVPDLKFINFWGLADATIARNPVTRPNRLRSMAHDRWPPPGYLAARGVNFSIHPAAASKEDALEHAVYAMQVGPDTWMPFNAPSLEWVAERFKTFEYDQAADGRFEETLKSARLLVRGPFDVYLDDDRLLYVKGRCDSYEPRIFLHIMPKELDDLPARSRRHGFENRDFDIARDARLGVVRRCVAMRVLPDYPIAAIRTGQFDRGSERHIWNREIRLTAED